MICNLGQPQKLVMQLSLYIMLKKVNEKVATCMLPRVSHFMFATSVNLFFFFFLTCPHKKEGEGIRTSDLHFMRHGPQLIELSLRDATSVYQLNKKEKKEKKKRYGG
jgi:hypothetical protein